MALFQHSVLKKYLSGIDGEKVDEAWEDFKAHFQHNEVQENIRNSKEEEYQGGFLEHLFVNVLGYTMKPAPNYNLVAEKKNLNDSKKADGALLDGEKVRGVIELKGTETTDLSKVESQAFGYKNKQPDAIYVIISNFEKLRFYIDNAVDYIEFNLFTLTKEEFRVLWLCLGYSNFVKGLPKKIKDASLTEEENVTKKLYKDYSEFKHDIFESVKQHNPDYDALLLFKKTQKLLDRFLFIFFAEDRNLLPPNSIKKIIQQWHQLKELDEYRPLYERFIKYFGYLNEGRKVPGKDEIFAYNGGLFAEDEVLDNLIISDELLYKHTLKLSTYDFVSEVDVNILGHIFEHSLNEIEEITAELEGEEVDRSKTRRKKDGVYYTPKYITKYIVEHTVGKLCEEQKTALDIDDEAFRPNRQKKTKKELLGKLEEYREWLLGVTICDPACGSGAFLNQALEFLIAEHAYVDELQAKLLGETMVLPDVENQILERNLFGVDINEESVEIAKLSLWLRTAQKGRKLTSLNHNIKCGNSLIHDPDVAGDKAFDWEAEFPTVFRKKEKQAFHVTWVTHNARTSQRMIDYKVKKGEPFWLNEELEVFITKEIAEIVKEDDLNVLAYNICEDHVHMLLVSEPDELSNIVRKLKGRSSQRLKEHLGVPKEEKFHLWGQKFDRKPVEGGQALDTVRNYILQNREKHNLPPNKGLQPLVAEAMCCTVDYAFRPETTGGFDVVIGNPPYVNVELMPADDKVYYHNQFDTFYKRGDLFSLFIELGITKLTESGMVSFIVPSIVLSNLSYKRVRELVLEYNWLSEVCCTGNKVFQDVTVDTVIFVLNKSEVNEIRLVNALDFQNHSVHIVELDYFEKFGNQISIGNKQEDIINDKLFDNKHTKVEDHFNVFQGIVTGNNSAFIFDNEKEALDKGIEKDLLNTLCHGRDISKWFISNFERRILYVDNETDINSFLGALNWLEEFESKISKSKSSKERSSDWYCLHRPRVKSELDQTPKIVVQNTRNERLQPRIVATIDTFGIYASQGINFIIPTSNELSVYYLLGILNSKLINYLFSTKFLNLAIKAEYLKKLKVPLVDSDLQNKIKELTKNMTEYHYSLESLRLKFLELIDSKFDIPKLSRKLQNWHELTFKQFLKELKKKKVKLSLDEEAEWMDYLQKQKARAEELKSQIAQTDAEIDAMVYELYGLSEEEVRVVEGGI